MFGMLVISDYSSVNFIFKACLIGLWMSSLYVIVNYRLKKFLNEDKPQWLEALRIGAVIFLITSLMYMLPFVGVSGWLILIPIMGFLIFFGHLTNGFNRPISLTMGTIRYGLLRYIGLFGFTLLIYLIFYVLIFTPVLWIVTDSLKKLLPPETIDENILNGFVTFLRALFASICGIISVITLLIASENFKEILTGEDMNSQIESMGSEKSVYDIS